MYYITIGVMAVPKLFAIFILIVIVSCAGSGSDVVIKNVIADINRLGQASLWIEVYNKGDELGEITRWRVEIDAANGGNITSFEQLALWGDRSGTAWSPLIGSKQVSKFCVHKGSGPTKYKGAQAKVAVWIRDEDGEYMITGIAEFPMTGGEDLLPWQ
jgi:hypothetical protein